MRSCIIIFCLLIASRFVPLIAADLSPADLQRGFTQTVRPFVETYCVSCHGKEKPKAELDLTQYSTFDSVVADDPRWKLILERLAADEMPPKKAKQHPTPPERQAAVQWIESVRKFEAEKNAGDPGIVLAHRLSNAEYDYTIRDLTGVDMQPTREFPVDPANQAGFDNSGESLAMSPALLKKYLQAAQEVASHLVLRENGFEFAPFPMLVETDRDKYCIRRIVDFYQRQPTDYAVYFMAAWQYKNRASRGHSNQSLADVAADSQVSPKYLATVWALLTDKKNETGPVARLRALWRGLPSGGEAQADAAGVGCGQMRDFVVSLRAKLEWDFPNLELKGFASGSQPFVGWKNRAYATHRTTLNAAVLQVEGAGKILAPPKPKMLNVDGTREQGDDVAGGLAEIERDPDLTIPADPAKRPAVVAAFERFCQVFPDTFYRSERGRMHFDKLKEKRDKGRLLSAGFHNMMGYFRDDQPLYQLVLDDKQQHELDTLWREFDEIAFVPERQHAEFIFYERAESKTIRGPEFDFARSEDKDITSPEKLKKLADVYLSKARSSFQTNGGDPMAIDVIAEHFKLTSANIRGTERARVAAEPGHLRALEKFAERAYRRPLTKSEQEDLLAFYHSLRQENGLGHEEALRDAIVSVLMSPYFCFRMDPEAEPQPEARLVKSEIRNLKSEIRSAPLSDYALASRLSYFLWSSMPDDRLLSRAAAGELHRPEVLVAEARRMLLDPRARAMAAEFGGNWLDFRRFEEHNAVDRDRFPSFNSELREAMFQEPIRFFCDVVERDRSILDFLYAGDTFVNPALAKHYGIAGVTGGSNDWVHVADATSYGRGGLLPMAVFLTKNAPGLRTSPVKRGYWVVKRVLGEQIPPPPAVVPELPHDEAKLGDLTLRQVLAKHREDPSCAACHARFDSFGLVFEGYGPVGEARTKDLGGRPVDAHAEFPGGGDGTGVEGLRSYLRGHRQDDFVDNLCRKMFVYALGRSLMLSDEPAIDQMRTKLAANDSRFSTLIEMIVTSPQFLNRRSDALLAGREE